MEFLQSLYDSGDVRWIVPVVVGVVIVLMGLVRLLFVERVGWALAVLIVFGGALSAVAAFENLPLGMSEKQEAVQRTAAAVGRAGAHLNAAVSANTRAIESLRSAAGEVRTFAEILAVASREQGGPVAVTDDEIAGFKAGIDSHLGETDAAIDRSRQAGLDAVRILGGFSGPGEEPAMALKR